MAQTWQSRRLRHEREVDAQLSAQLNRLGREVGRLVLRAATALNDDGRRAIPNRRAAREALRGQVWREVLRPYFIGAGDEPLDGPRPQSPYTALLVAGIRGGVAIAAARQVSIVARGARSDGVVRVWLTGRRPPLLVAREQAGGRLSHDPFHLFVDPGGYRLSDRVWNTAREVRRRIDRLLDYHIPRGTSAVELAELLEAYLTPGAVLQRTGRPYGVEGSYAARRLARTEVTAAAGRATVSANLANPYVVGTDWRLSARHPRIDICDELATLGMGGERLREPYPNDAVAVYPPHPHCLCSLLPAVTDSPAEVSRRLREAIEAQTVGARRLQGAFNREWLVEALLLGYFLANVLNREEAAA